ncbi:cytochrome P450 [Nocardia flavorosea]|uniref:Cytochrome P450 n=1 Tax=Nocardia flavorosea TaxID=53429 RepID=A0A846YB36_9NOCA|nr:cytochrome P450 [Nocardia flavorosea]NKY54991.1 cytochrome P450 [Nocardia flavorosea]
MTLHRWLAPIAFLGSCAALQSWNSYRRPWRVPHEYQAGPLYLEGVDTVPILGYATRLRDFATRPVEMIDRAARRHGEVVTIRIPGQYDLTYLNHPDGYATVLSLPTDHGSVGPVLGLVPTVGFWYPRQGRDPDSLQELGIAGKRILAGFLSPDRAAAVSAMIPPILDAHMRGWPPVIDLSARLYPAVYEIAGRYFTGDAFWDRYGAQLVPLLRSIANGIDVPRAALAATPFYRLMPEYRATGKLEALLARALREMPGAPIVRAIRDGGVAEADVPWMMMYVLWNAVTYPGSYTLWTLVDVLADPRVRRAVTEAPDPEEYLGWCAWETIRLNPVSALIRWLKKPLTYTASDGTPYYIPENTIVGAFPYLLNRDPERWPEPESYLPERFRGLPSPRTALFGTGPFGCVAGEFSRRLIAGVVGHILEARSVELTTPPPDKVCRVHLTYPSGPLPARVGPAAERALNTV